MKEEKQEESATDSPTKVRDMIHLAHEEKSNLQDQAQKINLKIETIDQVLLLLNGSAYSQDGRSSDLSSTGKRKKRQEYKINDELYPGYPSDKPTGEKIKYILEMENVAMLAKEIESSIIKIEGPILGKRTLKFVK